MFEIEPENTPTATLRRMLLLLIAALVVACGIAARADSVQLYDQVGLKSGKVTLADVAELQGPSAKALSSVEVASLADGWKEHVVTLDDVEAAMDKAGVNWGLVSLRGYAKCRVSRLAAPPESELGKGQAVAANIETPIGLDASLTLHARVEKLIAQRAGVPLSDLQISFSDHDRQALNIPALGRSIEIEPTVTNTLGRVPLVVRLYETGRITKTIQVRAQVRQVMLAVVARRPISRGQVFTRDDLEVRECYLEDDDVQPVTDPMLAVGQQADASMRSGDILLSRKVKAPYMVRRGELVTVRCLIGGLVVRSIGKASQDASLGDTVNIRMEDNHETVLATVAGRGEAVVRLGSHASQSGQFVSSGSEQEGGVQ